MRLSFKRVFFVLLFLPPLLSALFLASLAKLHASRWVVAFLSFVSTLCSVARLCLFPLFRSLETLNKLYSLSLLCHYLILRALWTFLTPISIRLLAAVLGALLPFHWGKPYAHAPCFTFRRLRKLPFPALPCLRLLSSFRVFALAAHSIPSLSKLILSSRRTRNAHYPSASFRRRFSACLSFLAALELSIRCRAIALHDRVAITYTTLTPLAVLLSIFIVPLTDTPFSSIALPVCTASTHQSLTSLSNAFQRTGTPSSSDHLVPSI